MVLGIGGLKMIEIENTAVFGWDTAIRSMRNSHNSWQRSDSEIKEVYGIGYKYIVGTNDLSLMKKLAKADDDHSKFARMINVTCDITAPLYFYKHLDTYKVGTVANSCSTMHTIQDKEFTLDDFSHEHLISEYNTNNYFEPSCDEKNADVRSIFDFPDYDVSEFGTVYSWKSGERVPLKQRVDIDGYKTVGLYKDGVCKRIKVHRLVANAFLDKIDGKNCVNHIDGNKWNNSKTNLEWCTRSENSKHASENGLLVYGSKQRLGKAKQRRFTKEQIAAIKELYFSDGVSQREIGKMFGCDHSVISEIVTGKIYKDIELYPLELLEQIVNELNRLRGAYLETRNKHYWYSIIQLLPSSYNQKRTVQLNYQVLRNMYKARKNHRLDEWKEFCAWIEKLPYFKEIYLED